MLGDEGVEEENVGDGGGKAAVEPAVVSPEAGVGVNGKNSG